MDNKEEKPVAVLYPPEFGKKRKTIPVYFYSLEEAKSYLMKLPKDWLVGMLLSQKEDK